MGGGGWGTAAGGTEWQMGRAATHVGCAAVRSRLRQALARRAAARHARVFAAARGPAALCGSLRSPAVLTSTLAPDSRWMRCTVEPPWPSTKPTKLKSPSCSGGPGLAVWWACSMRGPTGCTVVGMRQAGAKWVEGQPSADDTSRMKTGTAGRRAACPLRHRAQSGARGADLAGIKVPSTGRSAPRSTHLAARSTVVGAPIGRACVPRPREEDLKRELPGLGPRCAACGVRLQGARTTPACVLVMGFIAAQESGGEGNHMVLRKMC